MTLHVVSPYPSGGHWQEHWQDMRLTCGWDGDWYALRLLEPPSGLLDQWVMVEMGEGWVIQCVEPSAAALAPLTLQAVKVDGKPKVGLKRLASPPQAEQRWSVDSVAPGSYTIESQGFAGHVLTARVTSAQGAAVEAAVELQARPPGKATRGQTWRLLTVGL